MASSSDPGGPPPARGLYDPAYEHDSCGVGLVADLQGRPSHRLVTQALTVLESLAHRGASGAEVATGDGSGILLQLPQRFLAEVTAAAGIDLPEAGRYTTGIAFLPHDTEVADKAKAQFAAIADEEGLRVLGWRPVPVDDTTLGRTAKRSEPRVEQVFVAPQPGRAIADSIALDRLAYVTRKRAQHAIDDLYLASLSSRTLVYKGMLTAHQLFEFYPDLADERFESGLAIVHSRFSTNTFPSWPLAHPYRFVAHNGEINTVNGNRNWMRAREALLESSVIPGDLSRLFPICTPGGSDSATFDEVLELLHLGGRSLPHAVLMMIPEAWENHRTMDPARRAFYRYHASVMEPWDGPAAIAFTDGTVAGAVLDRNGLRPARYWVSNDGLVVLASEVGVLDLDPATIVRKGRLQPGRMFLVDTAQGRIVDDDEIKAELSAAHPYARWLEQDQLFLDDLPARAMLTPQHASVVTHQRLFGYTTEELRIIVGPMAKTGAEPVGSMGSDASIAVLSDRSRLLYDYFTQLFAQVTNPPLDAIREELVTSLAATVGPEGNLLEAEGGTCRQILLPQPVIGRADLAKLMYVNEHGETPGFKAFAIDGLFRVSEAGDVGRPTKEGGKALADALAAVRRAVSAAIADGANIIVLSDRNSTTELAPIPSLLLVAAVHHHLIREKTRTKVGLVVETGDARETHHMALLIGYGAAAVNPYLALESIDDMIASGQLEGVSPRQAREHYVKAACKGVLKVMSKMGISTVASYTGAQVFEAVGLEQTSSTSTSPGRPAASAASGSTSWRPRSPPATAWPTWSGRPSWPTGRSRAAASTSGAARGSTTSSTRRPCSSCSTRRGPSATTSSRSTPRPSTTSRRASPPCADSSSCGPPPAGPIPIEEVEPAESIMQRFSTGAMSYGSISAEAHENLAIAMNRIGGRSNTGEGGEDPRRYVPDANGDRRRSAIKQVASGRFGVTSEYLVNADDLQIKMAQGAKPGEGGQLPGIKVYPWIAKTAALDAGRRADLAAAAPRHLLDRGHRPADPRPEDGQPAGPHPREAGGRGGRRHRRGRGRQGPRRRRAHLGPRRRHRRGAAHLAQARRHPLGARPGRDPADAPHERPPGPDRRAGRRPAEDRARRRHRRAAGRRGVRLRHRPARRLGLRDDARLPPRHLPGRHRHAEPRAAQALHRQARVRRDLLRVHRRRGARAPGRASASARSKRRSAASSCSTCARPSSTGRRRGSTSRPSWRSPSPPTTTRAHQTAPAGPRARAGARPPAHRGLRTGARRRHPRRDVAPDPQHRPHRRHDARLRDHPPPRRGRAARRHDQAHLHRLGRPELRRLRPAPA